MNVNQVFQVKGEPQFVQCGYLWLSNTMKGRNKKVVPNRPIIMLLGREEAIAEEVEVQR